MMRSLIVAAALLFVGCADLPDQAPTNPPKPPVNDQKEWEFTPSEKIFGFEGEARYAYCPTIVKLDDGTIHYYFCGNPDQTVMIDNIYHIQINPDGSQTSPKSVLQPSAKGTWDSQHTCDPSVVEGDFSMNGTSYRYAMFYLGCSLEYYYNEIGVAFSNDLTADSWVKYPHQVVAKSWSADGDQSVNGVSKSWGCGQPSAISMDGAGEVLLTFTVGDMNGTRIEWAKLDCSNMDNFTAIKGGERVSVQGLKNIDNDQGDYLCNADFAIDKENDLMVMVRPVQPHPSSYPTFIPTAQELCTIPMSDFSSSVGKWSPVARITPQVSGYARNHNAGLERMGDGSLSTTWESSVVYYTVSKQEPEVSPSAWTHAEWTYFMWRTSLEEK